MNSPFKFLDSYTKEDAAIFFGRDREIEELYQKVFESKILILFGVSGTGKSSLIDCGLGNKIADSDWLPVNVRRGSGMIESLWRQLSSFAEVTEDEDKRKKEKGKSGVTGKQIVKMIKSVYLDHFKPIYLIFDQFEELFIFGDEEEAEEFIQLVRAILDSDVQCKFIFSIREEYLANATEFEAVIPEFLSNRLRVGKMTSFHAKEVIEGPCKFQGIEVEEGFADKLLAKLNPKGKQIELTYLQVYLDKIFQLASSKQGATSAKATNDEALNISFTLSQLELLGNVGDLLGSFLEDQIAELDDPESGLAILKSFVSVKGTKRQITHEEVLESCRSLGQNVENESLKELINKFVDLRILREKDDNGRYELRHDSLASKIYEKITLVEKELLEIRQFLETAVNNHEKRAVYLSKEDLKYIAPYEDRLFMSKKTERFIEESKRYAERARKRIRRITAAAAIVSILVMGGFSTWMYRERTISNENEIKFKASYFNSLSKEVVESDPTAALRLAVYALDLEESENIRQNLYKIYRENTLYKSIAKHEDYIRSVAFSPDGKSILTGSSDNTACMWDLDGHLIQVFKGHESGIRSVAFSPDGKKILTGSDDQTARLWDLSGNLIQVFKGHEDRVSSVAFSPDGQNILTGSWDMTARLWNLSGNLFQLFKGHEGRIHSVAVSSDGKKILTGSDDQTARLWDLSGNVIQVFKGHEDYIRSVAFSPDGKNILTGSLDKTAQLWDLSGNVIQVFKGHENVMWSVAFSPDGQNILTGSHDKTARLWDLSGNIIQVFKGHKLGVSSVTFSPDGKNILTGSFDKTVRLWDLSGNVYHVLKGHEGAVISVAFSPDGKNILTGSGDKTVRLWDLSGNVIQDFEGYESLAWSVAFSPDGKTILIGSGDGTARLWDLAGNLIQDFKGHEDGISSVAFSPDGKTILTGSFDKTARLWDLSGNVIQVYKGHEATVESVAFSPDGKTILTGSFDKTARLWDLSGNLLQVFIGHEDDVTSVVFSPDGQSILTGSYDKTARMWDLSGNLLQVFKGNEEGVLSVAFSPDGKNILTGIDFNNARLWDLSGNVIQDFKGHYYGVTSVAFSPDGKNILTGSYDKTARLWDVKISLQQFLEQNSFEKLSITQKFDYGISAYKGGFQFSSTDELLEGANYQFEKAKDNPLLEERKTYLKSSIANFQLLLKIMQEQKLVNPHYIMNFMDVYFYMYRNGEKSKKAIKEFNKLQEMLHSQADNDLLGVFNYYSDKCNELDSLIIQLDFPDKVFETGTRILNSYEEDATERKNIALPCSNLSFNLLFEKEFSLALKLIELARQADPSREIIYTNLPLAYLFNDQYEKAMDIYTKWKDKAYESNQDFETFTEVFLTDLDDLESQGITHPDIQKIRTLLNDGPLTDEPTPSASSGTGI
ncbi:hypothetical protein ACFLRQ_01560 [Bacteroidota bacterium]